MNLAPFIYSFCALTSLFCTILLFRGYAHARAPLLFWSGVCFVCLTANNLLVLLDLMRGLTDHLYLLREFIALAGLSVLLYGFIWGAHE